MHCKTTCEFTNIAQTITVNRLSQTICGSVGHRCSQRRQPSHQPRNYPVKCVECFATPPVKYVECFATPLHPSSGLLFLTQASRKQVRLAPTQAIVIPTQLPAILGLDVFNRHLLLVLTPPPTVATSTSVSGVSCLCAFPGDAGISPHVTSIPRTSTCPGPSCPVTSTTTFSSSRSKVSFPIPNTIAGGGTRSALTLAELSVLPRCSIASDPKVTLFRNCC